MLLVACTPTNAQAYDWRTDCGNWLNVGLKIYSEELHIDIINNDTNLFVTDASNANQHNWLNCADKYPDPAKKAMLENSINDLINGSQDFATGWHDNNNDFRTIGLQLVQQAVQEMAAFND